MPAIITDQYRILNAETFIDSFVGIGENRVNNYYSFLGHPNPTNTQVSNYGKSDWGNPIPDPIDAFDQENFYYDSMLFLKKITEDDVRRVVPRNDWQNGTRYDMYRNNYSPDNRAPQSKSTTLYESRYFVVNSEFNVYLCTDNGQNPDNEDGQKSLFEPTHTNTVPDIAGNGSDGYMWKYLYTISPSDIVKFVTSTYIPLPKKWGDTATAAVKDAAVDGKIETVIIKNGGSGYKIDNAGISTDTGSISGFRISGDGKDGEVTVNISGGKVESVSGIVGGSGYTFASIKFEGGSGEKTLLQGTGAQFEVVIPPKGGHGADIYRELGGFRVMLYSKYDNNVDDAPDYVLGNDFSRVGIIKNPLEFSGNALLNTTTATNLSSLKLKPDALAGFTTSQVSYEPNTLITQTISTAGIGSTAVGYVASWNPDTGILKYYQPVGFSTQSLYSHKKLNFEGNNNNPPITGGKLVEDGSTANLIVDTSFNDKKSITVGGKSVDLGQTFNLGKANPEIKKYSGEIIYIDNRAPITRTTSQKEEVKIVIEF